ncbi:His-Xaa-Ser system radical SAM maturase HxsC [Dokdonella immobilis]|uniref:His-Xaa-Ser system radical SAM maturase HxsC n=1 Tax=Dokdonella immobilis TaxID=578942 RepID=A0A1I4WAB1_9GAMM|nr:His-Xaa-Ser system radical SAM maturase HxsC [Dokdonella immobilis]SFN10375.1 His-Xaa-Ser system radical SAM maturase HxsC [Dokdonella immobilis]
MLPLDTKAKLTNWGHAPLLKVADLAEMAVGRFPFERMALDLRSIGQKSAATAELVGLPWAGFIANQDAQLPSGRPGVVLDDRAGIVRPGDVIELQPLRSRVLVRYRRGDASNVLFATEQCNSYCMMCSQPPHDVDDAWRIEQMCELVKLIDADTPSLAISGGEPTLLGAGLNRVIGHCADRLPATPLHVLTNGRRFSAHGYAATFEAAHPALSWGVPLYGDHFCLHDYVVQSSGAFAETIKGLYALHQAGQRIEIRVVLVKPTVERLQELVRYLYRNLPFVEHVALMGIEPTGFAKAHYDDIWIDPADMADALEAAVEFLAARSMAVSLFNLPLCALSRSLWPFARQSISNWKRDYLPPCEGCLVRERCAGFFSWTTDAWTSRAIRTITHHEEGVSCEKH